jgi:hypothetical protein
MSGIMALPVVADPAAASLIGPFHPGAATLRDDGSDSTHVDQAPQQLT